MLWSWWRHHVIKWLLATCPNSFTVHFWRHNYANEFQTNILRHFITENWEYPRKTKMLFFSNTRRKLARNLHTLPQHYDFLINWCASCVLGTMLSTFLLSLDGDQWAWWWHLPQVQEALVVPEHPSHLFSPFKQDKEDVRVIKMHRYTQIARFDGVATVGLIFTRSWCNFSIIGRRQMDSVSKQWHLQELDKLQQRYFFSQAIFKLGTSTKCQSAPGSLL